MTSKTAPARRSATKSWTDDHHDRRTRDDRGWHFSTHRTSTSLRDTILDRRPPRPPHTRRSWRDPSREPPLLYRAGRGQWEWRRRLFCGRVGTGCVWGVWDGSGAALAGVTAAPGAPGRQGAIQGLCCEMLRDVARHHTTGTPWGLLALSGWASSQSVPNTV